MDCTTMESRLRTECKSGISKLSADVQTSDIHTDRQAGEEAEWEDTLVDGHQFGPQ